MSNRFVEIHHMVLGAATVTTASLQFWLNMGWSLDPPEQAAAAQQGDSTPPPDSIQECTPVEET